MPRRLFYITLVFLLTAAFMIPATIGQASLSVGPLLASNARFRVVIAQNLSSAVDVWVDGVITAESGLKAVKPLNDSGSITVTAAAHTITLTQTGTTTAVGTPFTFTFTASTNIDVILLPDNTWMTIANNGTAPLPSQATARVINLSPNNNPVSVALDGTVPTQFSSIAYKAAGASYVAMPVGVHALSIPGTSAKVISYNFLDGHVYSIYVFWDPVTNLPKILASAETNFLTGTSTPTVVGPTSTPGPRGSGPIKVFIPMVDK